jgi:hypothetical protein
MDPDLGGRPKTMRIRIPNNAPTQMFWSFLAQTGCFPVAKANRRAEIFYAVSESSLFLIKML